MQSTGKVQQAYLFEISQELFQVLLSHSDVKLTALGDLKPYLAIKESQDEIHEIEMAVPLSPEEVKRKRLAIFKHQSQKDLPVFPGDDSREFWVRAEDRTSETANAYNQLGLAEYAAIEAFRRFCY